MGVGVAAPAPGSPAAAQGEAGGGRLVAQALKRHGTTHLFTLCGGHIQAIYDGCLDEAIRVIDVRHEQAAVHAADGYARMTGRPGVCAVTAGPGVTDVVTAVANAQRAQIGWDHERLALSVWPKAHLFAFEREDGRWQRIAWRALREVDRLELRQRGDTVVEHVLRQVDPNCGGIGFVREGFFEV